jgi:hypothetical protein
MEDPLCHEEDLHGLNPVKKRFNQMKGARERGSVGRLEVLQVYVATRDGLILCGGGNCFVFIERSRIASLILDMRSALASRSA